MSDKERAIELANAIKDFFLRVLENAVNQLRKNDEPYDFKGEIEFSDEVDEDVKEPLKDFIDAICQITISKVRAICKK